MSAEEGLLFLLFAECLGNLGLLSQLRKFILCHELADGHYFVELKISGCHELSSHNPVQHLIEVDESIVDIDAHLKHGSVYN